jgi:succinate dehydrogenase/fumarate reductase cytochrome b subunit
MARKSVNFYLIKTVRVSGWILFFIMLLFISTGFALCGKFGFTRVIGTQKALTIHKIFDVPLIFLFLVHSLIGIYLAFRRWGWIKKRTTH